MRLASVADASQMATLAAVHVPEQRDAIAAQLIGHLRAPETCVGFVVDEGGALAGWGIARYLEPKFRDDAHAPSGWYLLGLIVRQDRQRRGHGSQLTRARLTWLSSRTDRVYCFTALANEASQRLHDDRISAGAGRSHPSDPGLRWGAHDPLRARSVASLG